ncbi:hypothetical protein diail_8610 [Diaporthe ilicicola]|nr:hypothetical protein diail_8610 [Diaporthe ilicicola]
MDSQAQQEAGEPQQQTEQPPQHTEQSQRPAVCQTPTDGENDSPIIFDTDAIKSLAPGEWLESDVVDTFFKNLCRARPGICYAFGSGHLAVLDAEVAGLPENPTEEQLDQVYEYCRIRVATVSGNEGLVLMPFCIRYHWILVVLDFSTKLMIFYDSLNFRHPNGCLQRSEQASRADSLADPERILAFCASTAPGEWKYLPADVPMFANGTECGVYICLSALHLVHGHRLETERRERFDADRFPKASCLLGRSYWIAGRKAILGVCRRYVGDISDDRTQQALSSTEEAIDRALEESLRLISEEQHQIWRAQLRNLRCIMDAIDGVIKMIEVLGSDQSLEHDIDIQRKAREVQLTPKGEPFRDEIVNGAVQGALHDVNPLRDLKQDLKDILRTLEHEAFRTQTLRNSRLASQPLPMQVLGQGTEAEPQHSAKRFRTHHPSSRY